MRLYCPFCDKPFCTVGTLTNHLIKYHRFEDWVVQDIIAIPMWEER